MSEIINSQVANKCPIVTYAYAIYRIRTDIRIPSIGIWKWNLFLKK